MYFHNIGKDGLDRRYLNLKLCQVVQSAVEARTSGTMEQKGTKESSNFYKTESILREK